MRRCFLLLYIPFNLFLSLAIRELLLHSFERNRFRELFAILLISIGVLPQTTAPHASGTEISAVFTLGVEGQGHTVA